ncbi:pseudouridine synthase [Actomonas aquatica]|uniref:Pseudouridine synthase n=1 Tax=Actomonas aquatica TaxID=2866162 RepID=A0ABZ1CBA9_9BACT|nr:pseudouridine synthase [Opitutus sp. WL0086]WRQ88963.1 pseudouridine synthase [Opitutus sp. WL0086]
MQKFLADAGVCSRRAAEALIAEGEVTVNGQPAELGQRIRPGEDEVRVDGQRVKPVEESHITVAVHKPRGLVCSNDDPHNPRTVFDLLPPALAARRLFCAGRLDKDSEGLVILTTDGDLANRLMHPRNVVVKRYQVKLDEPFPRARLARLIKGVKMEDEWFKVERAALVNPRKDASVDLDVWMHHGKKREIRQLFLALGFPVQRLRRYQIGAFPLRGIPLRAVKQLSSKEIDRLFQVPTAPLPEHQAAVIRKPSRPRSNPS